MLHISRGLYNIISVYLRHDITQTNTEQIISFQHFRQKRDPISQNNALPTPQTCDARRYTHIIIIR